MAYPTRARLEARLRQVSAAYDSTREKLLDKATTCSQEEFLALNDEVDRAGDLLRHAEAALDLHIRQHSCSREGGADAAKSKQFGSSGL